MSAGPAFAALMGFIVLHEALTPRQLGAIAAIMLASLGTTLSMGRRQEILPPAPGP